MEFFTANDVGGLAERLRDLLCSPDRLEVMALQNFSAALQMSMPQIIRQYIHSFDMQQRVKMLKGFSRLRRSKGMPARRWMIRQLERNSDSWNRMAIDQAGQ